MPAASISSCDPPGLHKWCILSCLLCCTLVRLQFQDTPGASGPPGGGQLGLRVAGGVSGHQLYDDGAAGYGDEDDEYDLEDSFLVNGKIRCCPCCCRCCCSS